MSVFLLDLEAGNDANDGTTFANRWLTFDTGATAARIAPGDEIRVMASPDPTLVGDSAWTRYSKTVTLPGAVTANISDCGTVWTGSANVTQTTDGSVFKEGTASAKSVLATAFTTGKIAYFATGALDLSGYQQVSYWVRSTVGTTDGQLELKLCSDTTGDTAVHTIAVPTLAASTWAAFTKDFATALSASIQSIALYATTDPGTATINVDNVIACKAASAADSLTLTSLIGKVWNLSWAASTAYTLNHIRRPTQSNRNGYCYKATTAGTSSATEPTWPEGYGKTVTDGSVVWTCIDLEDTWYPVQSINGTTVKLDAGVGTLGNAGRGYWGTTETVATYKREPIPLPILTNTSGCQAKDNGTEGSPITYSGGWNRTNMSTQTGETWISGQNGGRYGFGFYADGRDFVTFKNLNATRCSSGFKLYLSDFIKLRNCHAVACTTYGIEGANDANMLDILGGVFNANTSHGIYPGASMMNGKARRIRLCDNMGGGSWATSGSNYGLLEHDEIEAINNSNLAHYSADASPVRLRRFHSANTAGSYTLRMNFPVASYLQDCLIEEGVEFYPMDAFSDKYIYSINHDQTAGNHLITTDGGTIVSATDQRHTASGIAWKFRPTSTNRHSLYPLRLSVAKIACNANAQVTLSIWTRRDSTNVKGQLLVRGGQIAGVPTDVTVACEPTINTWVQSGNLTFTPTAAGVVEVLFLCWDGVGTVNNYWIDDFASAQA